MKKPVVLILGAKSDIALAVAHFFAKKGYDLQLAARSCSNLEPNKSDLELRYKICVTLHEFECLDIISHERFADNLPMLPSIVVCAVGYMGDQSINEKKNELAVNVFRSNFEGPASIIGIFANRFEHRGSGVLVGISSVAGERGRASNYIYGSAKAGLSAYLSGLRNRLGNKGVHVVTVLPGFVETKMTQDLKLIPKLTAQPEDVARYIYKAVKKKRDVVYVKGIWLFIMLVIRNIPEKVFKKIYI